MFNEKLFLSDILGPESEKRLVLLIAKEMEENGGEEEWCGTLFQGKERHIDTAKSLPEMISKLTEIINNTQ